MTVFETPSSLTAADGVRLAARIHRGADEAGAVLCHPHPLFGGDMHNNVVMAARDAMAGLGLSTLRFDFRGAGQSGGSYDAGRGEGLDLSAAFDALATASSGKVFIVAYSFGAWVAARAVADLTPAGIILISPPVSFADLGFDGLAFPALPSLVVTGDADGFCGLAELNRWMGGAAHSGAASCEVLEGVDHFYRGAEARLGEVIARWISTRPARV